MSYINIPFPDCIAFGAESNVLWLTHIAQSIGGQDFSSPNWQDNKHAFDVSFAVRTASDYADVRAHFNEVRGMANTFPFKDHLDFTVTVAQGVLLTLALVAPTADGTFYLHKKYGSTNPYYRQITRPDTPVSVFRTRAAVTTDITGAGAAVTYTTGAVAITGHVAGDTYTWSGTFMVPCRYDTDRLPAAIINKEGTEDGELLVSCGSIPVVEVRE